MKSEYCSIRGSALVETTVLMVVMLPLVFALAMVGNLIDLKQTTEQASRYVSWETTVSSNADIESFDAQVRERFLTAADNPISSNVAIGTRNANALWGSAGSELGALQSSSVIVLDDSMLDLTIRENATQASAAMKIGQAAGRSGELLDSVSGNSWGLSTSGPSSVSLGVRIKSSGWLPKASAECSESGSHVCMSSRAIILGDGWSSSDDEQAERRVRSLVPATILEPVGNAVAVAGNLPLFKELKGLRGAFGHVDMSVLPEYAD